MIIKVFTILIFLLFRVSNSEEDRVRQSLVTFMDKLSSGMAVREPCWGWNISADPCRGKWKALVCDSQLESIPKIVLEEMNLTGILDAASLCVVSSLGVPSLKRNNISGLISEEIGNCKHLIHLCLSGNQFSGDLAGSLLKLGSVKRLDISSNNFSGEIANQSRISGLISFLAQNNQLQGELPDFDFSILQQFNGSNNNFSGPIPDVKGRFSADSFLLGNPELCGKPLSAVFPPAPPPSEGKPDHSSSNQFLIYFGYVALGLIVVLLFAFKLVRKKKPKQVKIDALNKEIEMNNGSKNHSTSIATSSGDELKPRGSKSEYSISSVDNGSGSSPLVVLTNSVVKDKRFEELLQAPAELVGRGKHGSLYKVMLDNRITLAVKRFKDWTITTKDFRRKMQKIDLIRHPYVLPVVAFIVLGKRSSWFMNINQMGVSLVSSMLLNWGSRLSVAANVVEALAFMHEELRGDGIAHGNLKSTNILFNKNMEPCVTGYGLIVENTQDQPFLSQLDAFNADVYGFGVILLELLIGKMVQNKGFDLATLVHSVVGEEWTIEVFDEALISEGANEERMVNLLQMALKCITPNQDERPALNQVATMINTKEEERNYLLAQNHSISST